MQRRKYRLLSDDDLILSYAEKPSRDILQVLYERYGHLVLGLCIKYLKQVQDAEDMCGNIFEKLPTLLQKHEIQYFKSWLYQVSRNECLMQLRKKHPHQSEIQDSLLGDDNEAALTDKLDQELELQKMDEAIKLLKEEQRICVTLFYIEENSYNDISVKLDLSIKSVKSHIQNGKRNLKNLMEAKP